MYKAFKISNTYIHTYILDIYLTLLTVKNIWVQFLHNYNASLEWKVCGDFSKHMLSSFTELKIQADAQIPYSDVLLVFTIEEKRPFSSSTAVKMLKPWHQHPRHKRQWPLHVIISLTCMYTAHQTFIQPSLHILNIHWACCIDPHFLEQCLTSRLTKIAPMSCGLKTCFNGIM